MFDSAISSPRGGKQKGQVIVMIALLSTVFIGMAGLAVDLVLAYAVKTFLATATDAAAMGGVRALERGVTYADQESEIQRLTTMLFEANFPDGILLTGNTGRFEQSVHVAAKNNDPGATSMFTTDNDLSAGMREVRVETIAEAPTFFMRFFGMNTVTVRASAYAARRDVNVMIVLDRSASLKSVGAWDDVQASAIQFLNKFDNNRDRVGLVTFGTGANVDYPLSSGFKTANVMQNLITAQTVPSSAYTNSSTGLWLAYSELLRVNDSNALNAIVFFTDGQPSAFSAKFKVKTGGSGPKCPGSGGNREGTLGSGQDTSIWNSPQFYDIRGFWKREAGGVPVNGGSTVLDHPQHPLCSGMTNDYGGNAEYVLDSSKDWPRDWVANEPGVSAKKFCIDDNQPGGCLGDAGDFAYSDDDSRLFNDSSNSSNSDFRGTNVHNAAKNLLLNIAQTARQDSSLGGVHIHTIGLGGYGYDADAGLMKRVSNDPTNSYGVQITAAADEPIGSYTYAPSIGEIQKAFEKVRSEVMRLTR
ncbi:MAG: VWA domain-containing protein [Acidobacteria bacterium]|nr:VWA domain-containing protein [Acidobacteriota bacterium]